MVVLIGRGENFALVDVVYRKALKYLRLYEMAYSYLSHYRDGNCILYFLYHLGVGHSCHAAHLSYIRGNSLKRHYGYSSGFLSDFGLLSIYNIHDNAALEHLGEVFIQLISFIHLLAAPSL